MRVWKNIARTFFWLLRGQFWILLEFFQRFGLHIICEAWQTESRSCNWEFHISAKHNLHHLCSQASLFGSLFLREQNSIRISSAQFLRKSDAWWPTDFSGFSCSLDSYIWRRVFCFSKKFRDWWFFIRSFWRRLFRWFFALFGISSQKNCIRKIFFKNKKFSLFKA